MEEIFKQQIFEVINNAGQQHQLTLGGVYYIMKDVLNEIGRAYAEQQQELQKQIQEQAEKEGAEAPLPEPQSNESVSIDEE